MLVGGVNPADRISLSASELEYISGGVNDNLRADGRGRLDWRVVSAELNPVPQAAGSSRLRLGGTEVLVSVKGDIGRPLLGKPSEGRVVCTVESSAVFNMNMVLGSGNEDRLVQDRNNELSAIVRDILIKSGALNLEMLSIVEGRHCWILYLDVLVLDYEGNLIDTIVMAAGLALSAMRLPLVRIEEGGEATEIVLAEETDLGRRIDPRNLPISITIGRIGNGYIVDPSDCEETCCESALIISLVQDHIVAMRKLGCGMLDPGLLSEYVAAARQAANYFKSMVEESLINKNNK